MDNRMVIEISVIGKSVYSIHFDLETMKLFTAFLQQLKDNVIEEFELFSNNKLFYNNLVVIIKKAVEEDHPTYSPHLNNSTLINGVFTYVIDDGLIDYWMDNVCNPWILSNGRALIYDTVWDTTALVPVKSDPSGRTFKRISASFVFS